MAVVITNVFQSEWTGMGEGYSLRITPIDGNLRLIYWRRGAMPSTTTVTPANMGEMLREQFRCLPSTRTIDQFFERVKEGVSGVVLQDEGVLCIPVRMAEMPETVWRVPVTRMTLEGMFDALHEGVGKPAAPAEPATLPTLKTAEPVVVPHPPAGPAPRRNLLLATPAVSAAPIASGSAAAVRRPEMRYRRGAPLKLSRGLR